MTQLRKGTAERTGLTHEKKIPANDNPPEHDYRETQNEADIALRKAREKAEVERAPGGKEPRAGAADVNSLMQNPPDAAGEE